MQPPGPLLSCLYRQPGMAPCSLMHTQHLLLYLQIYHTCFPVPASSRMTLKTPFMQHSWVGKTLTLRGACWERFMAGQPAHDSNHSTCLVKRHLGSLHSACIYCVCIRELNFVNSIHYSCITQWPSVRCTTVENRGSWLNLAERARLDKKCTDVDFWANGEEQDWKTLTDENTVVCSGSKQGIPIYNLARCCNSWMLKP